MIYQVGIKHFYQSNIVFTHFYWKIRLFGTMCPTIKKSLSPPIFPTRRIGVSLAMQH
jgi:hypothetical protein